MSVATHERRMSRAEKVALIRRTIAEHPGWTQRQVAGLLGMTYAALRNLLNDPDGSKQLARRERYRRPCRGGCGRMLDGSSGFKINDDSSGLCRYCFNETLRRWTPETIIEALQKFARRYGRSPRVTDLSPAHARQCLERVKSKRRRRVYEKAIERFERDGCWPSHKVIKQHFPSMNAALQAAGLAVNPRQRRWNKDLLAETLRSYAMEDGTLRYKDIPYAIQTVTLYHFGTIRAAREYAGLKSPVLYDPWPRHRIIAALWLHAREDGTPPSGREWQRGSTSHPVTSRVTLRFGSWNEAIYAAGFEPRQGRPPKERRPPRRDRSAGVVTAAEHRVPDPRPPVYHPNV